MTATLENEALPRSWDIQGSAHGRTLQYRWVDEPAHCDSNAILAVWREREADGGFAVGHDIPSRRLAPVLHSLMVMEPIEGDDYRIRIAGSALRRRFGREVSGLKLTDLFRQSSMEPQRAHTREVLRSGHPCILRAREFEERVLCSDREVLVLRVLAPDRKAHWIMAGIFYFD